MKVIDVLHMNGGVGGTSYANNSLVQKNVISMTKPIVEQAIMDLYSSCQMGQLNTLCIADLGCSSGPNTLFVVSELIKAVEKNRKKMGHPSPEFQVYLNDLPGNDFNTIFQSLSCFHQNLSSQMAFDFGPCFFTGVPGSFYGRLFASKSLHFVHSSYSLQWLSRVPEGVENNKGNIYMASSSPPSVIKAYYEQFQRDFSVFLKCRSQELVAGGHMVLTFLGRRSDDPSSKECCYIWELLAMALGQMVLEGTIAEDKLDSFNIPQYTPNAEELKSEIQMEGSFVVDRLEVSEVNWNSDVNEFSSLDLDTTKLMEDKGGYNIAMLMRAVAEPLLVSHFGEAIIEEVFGRYKDILADRISKERTEFINVTVSVTKKW